MALNDLKDNVVIVKNFIPFKECIEFLQRVPANFLLDGQELSWEYRLVNITAHPITSYVENYWNNYFKTNKIKIYESVIQMWPPNSYSGFHVHDLNDRRQGTYNSILYLNDNFSGGEFFTNKIKLKPEPGTLIFFNGKTTPHGLNRVFGNSRYAINFWMN